MTIEVGGGGGGLLKLVAFDSGRVNTGASGDIISVTAGADQYLKLTYLMCRFSTLETGITLTINGIGIFTNGVLADTTPVTSVTGPTFGISKADGGSNISNTPKLLESSQLCTSFTVTKVTGTTAQAIEYAYETLEKIT
tara:strand:- start:22 stop:438 length:417 start_codon:yes stop_codon:yes gene_type:complete